MCSKDHSDDLILLGPEPSLELEKESTEIGRTCRFILLSAGLISGGGGESECDGPRLYPFMRFIVSGPLLLDNL